VGEGISGCHEVIDSGSCLWVSTDYELAEASGEFPALLQILPIVVYK
jgi:hypothetical protein